MKLTRSIEKTLTPLISKQHPFTSTTEKPTTKATGTTDRPPNMNQGQNGQYSDNCSLSSSALCLLIFKTIPSKAIIIVPLTWNSSDAGLVTLGYTCTLRYFQEAVVFHIVIFCSTTLQSLLTSVGQPKSTSYLIHNSLSFSDVRVSLY